MMTRTCLLKFLSCSVLLFSPAFSQDNSVEWDFYSEKVQPVLDSRCVACHGCYTAPCQLKLTSYEGVMRGAHKLPVYRPRRLFGSDLTRLGIDAETTIEWRKKGFFPVVSQKNKLLSYTPLIRLLKEPGINEETTLSRYESIEETPHWCPLPGERTDIFKRLNPTKLMPYGFPGISREKQNILRKWVGMGSPGPKAKKLSKLVEDRILVWEKLFNGTSLKDRLAARYLYEHLFLAHLYFEGEKRLFFRLVRAKNLNGKVQEIATRRPYDDPGKTFYYRLKPVTETIVRKNHLPYLLSTEKLNRLKELFFDRYWNTKAPLPPYGDRGANPFVIFQDIPAESRYRFLLEDAHYHVSTFIRGPVCRGDTAVNVINDHFHILFLDPESDLSVQPEKRMPRRAMEVFYAKLDPSRRQKDYHMMDLAKNVLHIPANSGGSIVSQYWNGYYKQHIEYTQIREAFYDYFKSDGFDFTDIWDGDGKKKNLNAVLTVYRHYDSASVTKGFRGSLPKTVWVMDYPIFERIVYNLVVGFDVYGNFGHQGYTRTYMDNLRMQSEDLFLAFMPKEERVNMRREWNRGQWKNTKYKEIFEGYNSSPLANIDKTKSKYSFIEKILLARFQFDFFNMPFVFDEMNCCDHRYEKVKDEIKTLDDFEKAVKKVTGYASWFAKYFPDVSYLSVYDEQNSKAYTIVHNKAHMNVSTLFVEKDYREPDKDNLNIVEGLEGSYPNAFFVVQLKNAKEFLNDILAIDSIEKYEAFVFKYGIARNQSNFWEHYDWFQKYSYVIEEEAAGVIDLIRFGIHDNL